MLDSAPTDDVTIGLTSNDTTEGTVGVSSVTFTTANWSTPQTVTVTGVDDTLDDSDTAYSILTAAATSSDGNYSGLDAADVSVTNTDNDTYNTIYVDTTSDVADGTSTSLAALLANKGADGFISLREAIAAANNTANGVGGADRIYFNIAGAGVKTIKPTSALPTISEAIFIDGTTQPGYSTSQLLIELDGSLAGSSSGLTIDSGNSTVRGLIVNRWANNGIRLGTGGGNTIVGNWIGLDSSGTADAGNVVRGIEINASSSNTIGGSTAADRNVISGNDDVGIRLVSGSNNNVIQGNYVGTNAAGTVGIANALDGIAVSGSTGNTIGGTAAGAGNVVSSNHYGITLNASNTTTIQGNLIGTNAAGTAALGNTNDAIWIFNTNGATIGGTAAGAGNVVAGSTDSGIEIGGASTGIVVQGNFVGTNLSDGILLYDAGTANNTIGGTTAGACNVVANNSGNGVFLDFNVGAGNAIQGNSIYANGSLGIELVQSGPVYGVTFNDVGDGDSGANALQNFPVLTGAFTDATGNLAVTGSFNSTANSTFRVEFFANTSGDEGQTYLGYRHVITAVNGDSAFAASFDATVVVGANVTATATNLATGNTSEFSAVRATTAALIVDTTNDVLDGNTSSVANLLAGKGADGFISLREAIIATNNTAGIHGIYLSAGTYVRSILGSGENAGVTGDLDILDDLTIFGAGASSTTVLGGTDRVFHVLGSADVAFTGLTISSGNAVDGAGIFVESGSSAIVTESNISGNTATSSGGGIANDGAVWLDQVRVTGNTANEGGGLENPGVAVISNSLFDVNTGTASGGGIQSKDGGSIVTLVNVTLSGNVTTGTGGGVERLRSAIRSCLETAGMMRLAQ
ncbi:MAG: right-handed parallel beta-helix repeat-containing protein [Planctomycetia bacterium]|nr:right-handed parallel beta-helix repeat-containing protein [Planctomycetia bacterium]